MINNKKAEKLIEQTLDYAKDKTQGAEVIISSSDVATSRFANNSMTQNQSPERTEISLRVIKNGRQARLSTDDLSSSNIEKLVDDALAILKFLEKDETLLQLPGHKKGKDDHHKVDRFDKLTAELSAEQRAKAVGQIIKVAKSSGLQAAGVVATGAHLVAIGNSRGLFASHKETQAQCSITMKKDSATGWVKADETSFSKLDCQALAQRAAAKALANVNPVEIPPGKYRVILEPSAVLDLLTYLAYDFSATSHIDKLSCLLDQQNKKVFGDNISIFDDCRHPFQAGATFDGEGLARQPIKLVEHGVLKNLVYGRRSAEKLKTNPTGHGLAEPCAEGELACNFVIEGGDTSLETMIAAEERAILLTRVWYIREVDPTLKIVTGMTRDGTFLVENGKIKSAVKNLRFNQSLLELLNNVKKLSASVRTAGEEGSPAVVPAMLVENFNFSSTTTF